MLEGEWGIEAPPLAPLVADVGARLSGLRLADATLILKIENRSAAAQVRMRPGLVHTRPGLDSEVEMGPGPGLRLGFRSGQRQAIERLEELRNLARGPGPDAPHPADRELLTVLDGHLAGKPWREPAVDLYDAKRVAADWKTESWVHARRRRMEWDTQGRFTPRAMWLIGSGFRRARLRATGSRARDRCFTDSAARCVTLGPTLISGWRRSGESQRPTRARHFGWPCVGSAANRLGGRPANGTRRAIPWLQVNGFRWDRIRRIGHCPFDDKKWGTVGTDPLRSERLRIIPRVSTLELYSIRFRIACLGKRRGKSIS